MSALEVRVASLPARRESWSASGVLGLVGAVLVVAGVVTWVVAGKLLADAERVAGYSQALGVPAWFNDSGVGGSTIWMWVGIAAVIVGALAVVAALIVRAVGGRRV